MSASSLGELLLEALQTDEKRELSEPEKNKLSAQFYERMSERIDSIREEQRRAYEESFKLTLA